jgi:uncharacterized protein YutE (UPF0331/DUF86 family)
MSPSKLDRERRRSRITEHLADFPRQYAALESAMGSFGIDFDLPVFKVAFETEDDMDAYNRVQAVERGIGRVQNYVAELADAGARLADLPLETSGSDAERAFEALRVAGVISGELCRRLKRAQGARSRIEHGYVRVPAGDVHREAELVHDAAGDFIGPFRSWIEQELQGA